MELAGISVNTLRTQITVLFPSYDDVLVHKAVDIGLSALATCGFVENFPCLYCGFLNLALSYCSEGFQGVFS